MILRDHGSHIDIEGDDDILQIAGIDVGATPLREGEAGVSIEALRYYYVQAWRTKKRDNAVLYAIMRVNYISQINAQRNYQSN
ncbi:MULTISPECIES: hypothetical protein [Bacillus]|uniref:hypothetical protein n=1 Tax=Bacillus TaxID=1386 RepID=UPI000BF0CBAA|nr:hypothetical protein [Bacillus toyonensis]PEI72281.1 hypothetical protein CN674_17010 [Bacillus toyonensis]